MGKQDVAVETGELETAGGGDSDSNTSDDDDDGDIPLELNYEAIKHIATYYLPGGHDHCIRVEQLAQGAYHEVKTLHFEDGWTCIGRFLLGKQSLGFAESEVATMRYVKKHTSIPVPEVYFVNYNSDHVVGAPFILMELLEGVALQKIWHDLSLDHKKAVISQVADVKAQLASLKFDVIGSLTESGIGPSRENGFDAYCDGIGPYKMIEEYFYGLMDVSKCLTCCDECAQRCAEIRPEVKKYFDKQQAMARICGAPFVLFHGDFDMQNLLWHFSSEDDEAPKLTGVIDWDGSQTVPLYYLYDYPIFIQDNHYVKEKYADNKILRQHLVHELAAKHPEGSQERQDVRDCFYKKNYFLQQYAEMFPKKWDDHDSQASVLRYFLRDYYEGDWSPYDGRADWAPDTDSEKEDSSDAEESDSSDDTDLDTCSEEGDSEEEEPGEEDSSEDIA
ncbi:hypothetical protein CLAFUW4_11435 [Fulvia fulva]|nr:hypothetical protein CLAFUR4_11441 [Fulvia fulva]WPV17663.1 hypothetical protein CLAFUW4_11435 [Fulvia fulva]WPV32150.1 hypothetical protein CLAFUW7_11431 [Fulvia fulva]